MEREHVRQDLSPPRSDMELQIAQNEGSMWKGRETLGRKWPPTRREVPCHVGPARQVIRGPTASRKYAPEPQNYARLLVFRALRVSGEPRSTAPGRPPASTSSPRRLRASQWDSRRRSQSPPGRPEMSRTSLRHRPPGEFESVWSCSW